MKTLISLSFAIMLSGCATRMSFPSAKTADIIACRHYASRFGWARVNGEFNACMLEAGYRPQ
jgi:uncharacterized protein YceK